MLAWTAPALILLGGTAAFADTPAPPPPPAYLHLGLEGELELEFVNVEGPGGFENEDTTQLRVENRSAHVKIDKAVLAPKAEIYEVVTATMELRGDSDGASIDRAYAATRWLKATRHLSFRFELGKNNVFVRPKRRTEAYPLLGTAFWKGREMHATIGGRATFEHVEIELGVSGAQKRPFGTDDAAEDKSFNMLVLDDTRLVTGTTFVAGAKAALRFFGVTLMGYGFLGSLANSHDTQFLDQNLRDYATLGDRGDETHRWFGGRARFDGYGVHVVGEALHGTDGLLPRIGWYAQASYDFGYLWNHDHLWLKSVEPIFRWGQLIVEDLPANPDEPESWDREMIVFGVMAGLTEFFKIKAEYYVLNEVTEGDGGPSVHDNQLLVQVETSFDARIF